MEDLRNALSMFSCHLAKTRNYRKNKCQTHQTAPLSRLKVTPFTTVYTTHTNYVSPVVSSPLASSSTIFASFAKCRASIFRRAKYFELGWFFSGVFS